MLVVVAKKLSTDIRDNDILVRWGGEEFILIVENKLKSNGSSFAKRLIQKISSEMIQTAAGELKITISAGATIINSTNFNRKI